MIIMRCGGSVLDSLNKFFRQCYTDRLRGVKLLKNILNNAILYLHSQIPVKSETTPYSTQLLLLLLLLVTTTLTMYYYYSYYYHY